LFTEFNLKVGNKLFGGHVNLSTAKRRIVTLAILLTGLTSSAVVFADAAIEPVVSVGGTTGNCALLQVTAGNFNAGGYLAIDVSTPGGRSAFATASMAFALGKHIWVNRTVQAVGCYGLSDYATDVRIQQN
jgi:hypothetical protein